MKRCDKKSLEDVRNAPPLVAACARGPTSPAPAQMVAFLDTSSPLGVSPKMRRAPPPPPPHASAPATSPHRPPYPRRRRGMNADGAVVQFLTTTRLAHRTKVILCQVGDFYESHGYDAVLLAQFADLNPMKNSGRPFRAGFPLANLAATCRALTDAGLSVVIAKEARHACLTLFDYIIFILF